MESEKIHTIIAVLDEIQKLNIKNQFVLSSNSRNENLVMIHRLLIDSTKTVAKNSGISFAQIERTMVDINAINRRGFQLVHFCYYVVDWLITGDKTTLKEVIMKNIESDYDVKYINNWYE